MRGPALRALRSIECMRSATRVGSSEQASEPESVATRHRRRVGWVSQSGAPYRVGCVCTIGSAVPLSVLGLVLCGML
ncbi:hypothetical protein HDK77DRAFT_492212 [Phyllosticta capitalensis]